MAQSVGAVALDIVAGKNTLNSTLKSSMSEAQNTVSSGSSGISKVLGGIGSVAGTVAKTVGAGMAVAGTAVVAMGKSAVSAYADYEQLVGGVETLFKDSAKTVIENASKAYTTAGMSANEYMSTVTSFSASLLQSLGNDTIKASEKADMAITDMSDNANKMGTSMEMIQNAYQGFAKQNYTMLDNLKLGYGGTKEEMQRLLADAEKISGIKYDISSYADIVDAIHVVQNEMGITGTTAKEASSTISGSLSSMKGAWQNLLTGMGDDTQDFGALVDQFVSSVDTVGANLLPRIEIVLGGVVKLVQGLAPKIIEKIPELVSQLLPSIITASVSLIQAIVAIIPDLVNAIVAQIPAFIQGFVQIIDALIQALPTVVQSLVQALPTLIPALVTGLVQMIVALCQVIPQIIQPIIDNLPSIIISIVSALVDNLPALIQGAISLIMGIVQALPQIIQALIDALPTVVEMLVTALLQNIPALISGFIQVFIGVAGAYKEIFASLTEVFPKVFEGIWGAVKNIFAPAGDWFKEKFINAKDKIVGVFSNIKEKLSAPFEKAKDAIKSVVDKIKGFFTNLKLTFPNISLPHFSLSPRGWKIGDLLKGSIPKLSIDWYAKAMNNPMIMTKPTIFGYDAGTGNLLGGGEAGSELVVGTNTLLSMIKSAVASVLGGTKMSIEVPALQNVRAGSAGSDSGLSDKMDRLIELFKQFIESGNSDMTMPIYIGNELIDEYILNKNNRNVLRSGGHA
jgi:phage-related protein